MQTPSIRSLAVLLAASPLLLVGCAPGDPPANTAPVVAPRATPVAPSSGTETVAQLLSKVKPEQRGAVAARIACLARPLPEGGAAPVDTNLVRRAIVDVETNPGAANAC